LATSFEIHCLMEEYMCYNVIFFVADVYFMNKINVKMNIFIE